MSNETEPKEVTTVAETTPVETPAPAPVAAPAEEAPAAPAPSKLDRFNEAFLAKALRFAPLLAAIVVLISVICIVSTAFGYLFCDGASFNRPDFNKDGKAFFEDQKEAPTEAPEEFRNEWKDKLIDAFKGCDLKNSDAPKKLARKIYNEAYNDYNDIDESLPQTYVEGILEWLEAAQAYGKEADTDIDDNAVENLLAIYKSDFDAAIEQQKEDKLASKAKDTERLSKLSSSLLLFAIAGIGIPLFLKLERNTRA